MQIFEPRTRELGGVRAIFEYRASEEVDIEPDGHLLCVNFQTQRDATYAYAGAPAWHGTRMAGMAHLIEPGHRIEGFVREPTDHVVVEFERLWLADLATKSLGAGRFDLVSNGVPYRDETLRRLCEMVRDELANDADALMLDALATAAAVHLLRTTSDLDPRPVERRRALPPRKLALIKDAIDANLAEGIRLSDLARLVDLSPDHLWRCFRAETGVTPRQYQMQRRIDRVAHLIADPETKLSDVSAAVGFSSQSHMTKAFREAFGTTPARWRRMQR